MKLSLPERLYVNGFIRNLVQRPLEFHSFNRIAPFPRHARVLEIGCGNGGNLAFVSHHYQPQSLTGIDVDPAQVAVARRTLRNAQSVNLSTASADALPFAANSFDVILCIGVLHHMPQWPLAVAECARLLRHGGLLYGEEFFPPLLNLSLVRKLAPHPQTKLSQAALAEALARNGFTVLGTSPKPTGIISRWVHRYLAITVSRLGKAQAA